VSSALALVLAGPRDVPPPARSPGEIRRAARDILAGPEFRPPTRSLAERARDFVFDRINHLLSTLVGGGRGGVVAWVVLAVALAVIGYLVYRLLRVVRRDPSEAMQAAPVRVEPFRPAREWLADADAYEAAGQWRDAVRARYRALIADLARRGLVEEIPGRTDGEYRAEMEESAPRSAGEFSAATDVFEQAWYGNRRAGPEESAAIRALADRVLAGVR